MNTHLQTHAIEPEEIMAYLDGELPVEQAARVAAHLGQCPDCQSLADDLQQVIKRLREKGHRITLLNEQQFWRLAGAKK